MADSMFRWAIVGVGAISSDFATALSYAPDRHKVEAVASRSEERAKTFAERFNIPRIYGTYEGLLDDNDIDCVYIGTQTTSHCELSCMFMNAGKNVLCEKPLAMNLIEAKEMVEKAKEKNVFFAEGHWTRYFPAMKELRSRLDAGDIGKPQFIDAPLAFNAPEWVKTDTTGLRGAFSDLGCYLVHFATIVCKDEPIAVDACGLTTDTMSGLYSSVSMFYKDGRIARLMAYIDVQTASEAIIYGDKGMIKMPHFWCPTELTVNGERINFPLWECDKPLNFRRTNGLLYEADGCREYIRQGLKESPLITHAESLKVMKTIDRIEESRRVLLPSLKPLHKH